MKTRYVIPATLRTLQILALADDLLALATARRQRAAVATTLAAVKHARDALAAATAAHGPGDDPVGPALTRSGRRTRRIMSALARSLRAHAELPAGSATGDEARALLAEVFPRGTSFLHKTTAAELERATRDALARATAKGVAARLAALGCGPLVAAAEQALASLRHDRAQRHEVADAPAREGPSVWDARRAALSALREHVEVVRAVARVEGSDVDRELLAPVTRLRAPRRAVGEGAVVVEEAPPSRAA